MIFLLEQNRGSNHFSPSPPTSHNSYPSYQMPPKRFLFSPLLLVGLREFGSSIIDYVVTFNLLISDHELKLIILPKMCVDCPWAYSTIMI